jgi:hypothetical protein
MSMPWLNELTALMHIRDRAWNKIAGHIAIRARDVRHQVDRLTQLATDATMGHDTVDQMRATYRDLQKFARMLCEAGMGYRDAHRELGSLQPAREMPDDPLELVVPVIEDVRWLADQPAAASTGK